MTDAITKVALKNQIKTVMAEMEKAGHIYDDLNYAIPLYDEMDSIINDCLRVLEQLVR